jgi:site-specific recombinase XerD
MKQLQHHLSNQSTTATSSKRSLEAALQLFLQELAARNLSPNTITAYATDLRQFITWLHATDGTLVRPDQVTKHDITRYLVYLGGVGLSGVSRVRKLASLRSYFHCLGEHHLVVASPAGEVALPKKERKTIVYLRTEEYSRLWRRLAATRAIMPSCNSFFKPGSGSLNWWPYGWLIWTWQAGHYELRARVRRSG